MAHPRHFLELDLLDRATLRDILDWGHAMKHPSQAQGAMAVRMQTRHPLAGRILGMVFEKPSTRTRVSFEVAMKQLGGDTVVLSALDSHLGRGEPIADTARVLSRYVDAIMLRTTEKAKLDEMAAFATIPVINGLTNVSHPCQIMADLMTLEEHKGPVEALTVSWVGDGNNVANSWIHAAVRFGFKLRVATPPDFRPCQPIMDWVAAAGGGLVTFLDDPQAAAAGTDCIVTDTWVSMGVEARVERYTLLSPYRVDAALMALAAPDAVFMHCLPAKRGEEVTAEVIDGPQSIVWDEAENRLHAQKAILAWCFA